MTPCFATCKPSWTTRRSGCPCARPRTDSMMVVPLLELCGLTRDARRQDTAGLRAQSEVDGGDSMQVGRGEERLSEVLLADQQLNLGAASDHSLGPLVQQPFDDRDVSSLGLRIADAPDELPVDDVVNDRAVRLLRDKHRQAVHIS